VFLPFSSKSRKQWQSRAMKTESILFTLDFLTFVHRANSRMCVVTE